MNSKTCREFFLQPADPRHRRYEVLRSVFVDARPMKDVAQRFGVSYGTVRNWAGEFQSQLDAGQRPPFSFRHRADDPVVNARTENRRLPSRMSRHCHSDRSVG